MHDYLWYYAVAFLLLALTFLERAEMPSVFLGKIAFVILALFAGLRFETGYDWREYETFYNALDTFFSSEPSYYEPNLVLEPGFVLFLQSVKSLGGNFQAALLFIAAFNMFALYKLTVRYSNWACFFCFIYFCMLLLTTQMAAIRQSLSYSFVLFAFLAFEDRKYVKSGIFGIISVIVHNFSLAVLPAVYARFRPPPAYVVALIAGAGVALSYAGSNPLIWVATNVGSILGSGVSGRLDTYSSLEAYRISPFALVLLVWHIGVYSLLKIQVLPTEKPVSLHRITINMVLLSIFAHSYVAGAPVFWTRVYYLTLPLEILALSAQFRYLLTVPLIALLVRSVVGVASLGLLTITLMSPASLPYVPYQSIVGFWLTGDPGDGRMRYEITLHEAEQQIREQRR